MPAVACCSRPQRVMVGTQQLSPSSSPLNSSSPLLSHAATHRASEKDSYNACMLEDDPGLAACAVTIAVEGDPFKQEYSQLLGGSSQGSKFIFLGHSAQLTTAGTHYSLCPGITDLTCTTEKPEASTKQQIQSLFVCLFLI